MFTKKMETDKTCIIGACRQPRRSRCETGCSKSAIGILPRRLRTKDPAGTSKTSGTHFALSRQESPSRFAITAKFWLKNYLAYRVCSASDRRTTAHLIAWFPRLLRRIH